MLKPLVSVVIPFFSNKSWLREAINSVIQQSYENIEILVINDGSKEDITDIRIQYKRDVIFLYQSNGGPSKARNTGIEKSRGKYIAFLDSDDLWMKEKLEKQIHLMEKNNSIWSQHSYSMFGEEISKEKVIVTSRYHGDVYKDCFISFKVQTSTVIVKKTALLDKGIFFPLGKRYGQDLTFYKSLAKNYPLDYLDGTFSKFRIRGSNAGFRALVQLQNKSEVWTDIKDDVETKAVLPKSIIYAYKISYVNSNVATYINQYLENNYLKELVSKILYVGPYLIFRLNS